MLTTLSIVSRDQGKIRREGRPTAETPRRAAERAARRPVGTALNRLRQALATPRPCAACA